MCLVRHILRVVFRIRQKNIIIIIIIIIIYSNISTCSNEI